MRKLSILIIIFVLTMPYLISAPSLSKNQAQEQQNGFLLNIDPTNSSVKFSTYLDSQNDKFNIYSTFIDQAALYLLNYTLTPDETNQNLIPAPFNSNSWYADQILTLWTIPINIYYYTNITSYNYYLSNNTQFVTISGFKGNDLYYNIYVLNQNSTYISLAGNYSLAKITQFSSSPDVLFCLYNSTNVLILEYNFKSDTFTTVYQLDYSNPKGQTIENFNIFTMDNKIFASFARYNKYTTDTISTIFIYGPEGVIFYKDFPYTNYIITDLTPTSTGFIFVVSKAEFFYYDYVDRLYYQMSNQGIIFNSTSQSFTQNINLIAIRPFDNQSFLAVYPNNVIILKINSTNEIPSFITEYTYYTDTSSLDNNKNIIQAFTQKGTKYYLLNVISPFNASNVYLFNTNQDPSQINPNYQNSYYQTIQQYNNPYYYSSSSNYYTTSTSAFITNTNSNISILGILVILVLAAVGIAIFRNYYNKSNTYYPPRNEPYLNLNQNMNKNRTTNSSSHYDFRQPRRGFCQNCGNLTESIDVFCQNCGNRL